MRNIHVVRYRTIVDADERFGEYPSSVVALRASTAFRRAECTADDSSLTGLSHVASSDRTGCSRTGCTCPLFQPDVRFAAVRALLGSDHGSRATTIAVIAVPIPTRYARRSVAGLDSARRIRNRRLEERTGKSRLEFETPPRGPTPVVAGHSCETGFLEGDERTDESDEFSGQREGERRRTHRDDRR